MAVSNTDDFSLEDVKNEIENNGGSTTNSLVEAFANANANGFDSSYQGNKDSLLNFRNYNHIIHNILVIGTDATGAINSTRFHTISNVSATSVVSVKFTYIGNFVADFSPTVSYNGNTINIGYSITMDLNLDPSTYVIEQPFSVAWTNCDTGTNISIKMEVLSSSIDTVPTQNSSTISIYDHC
ncbi:hypothetical protein [Polaribacter sp. L3A8]|uniref:hypothetical protein n=1 Tax=Polaribacter sp. L3A8 TaxID=2686361 RepID=UPI00131C4495|nr:hypothetical protein [Polaribacter sp. L3A8]